AKAPRLLPLHRGHWCIENRGHHILDRPFDEDRRRIRTGHGPENMTRLRRFAIGALTAKGVTNVAQKMRQLTRNVRLVFDDLCMTINSCAGVST
ncbi:MAG: ISAs1 family transposase, partial [Nitrospirae bacterium]|nr:ISAs1 family transposase [Nitrospirota bacterium]